MKYFSHMTKLLKQAIEAVRALPEDRQDAIARNLLMLAEADCSLESD